LRACGGSRRCGRSRAALCLEIAVGLLCANTQSERAHNEDCEDLHESETSHVQRIRLRNQVVSNVELITVEKIRIEATASVRNIYKYYVSYKLSLESRAEMDAKRLEGFALPETNPSAVNAGFR